MPKAGKTSPSARGTGSASFRPSGLLASSPLVAAKPFYEACLRRRPGRHRYRGRQDPGSLGVQRLDRRTLCRRGCLDTAGGDVAVESPAVLAFDGEKVAIATERFTRQLCQLIPSNSPDRTSQSPALP